MFYLASTKIGQQVRYMPAQQVSLVSKLAGRFSDPMIPPLSNGKGLCPKGHTGQCDSSIYTDTCNRGLVVYVEEFKVTRNYSRHHMSVTTC